MVHGLRVSLLSLAMFAGGAAGGCGSDGGTLSLGLPPSVALPTMPKLPDLPAARGYAAGAPTETYALLARGVRTCWFGAGGPLKDSHVFHADAAPPSSGGQAEIVLHERDATAHLMRGARAYRIGIGSDGTGTRIEHTNHKFADALVASAETDVHRFAGGDLTCATAGATAPRAEPAPAAAVAPSGEAKRRQSASRG